MNHLTITLREAHSCTCSWTERGVTLDEDIMWNGRVNDTLSTNLVGERERARAHTHTALIHTSEAVKTRGSA